MSFTDHEQVLTPFLKPDATLRDEDGIPAAPMPFPTPGTYANAYYFGQPKWADEWFRVMHRYPELRERWHAAAGEWDGKVVVDIGCGPGNLFATIGGKPDTLIGVDVAMLSLKMAEELGYTPLLADAHDLPFRSEIADLVAMCATVHHMEDMEKAIRESARLVAPGGHLVIDHDPQKSAIDFRGPGRFLWEIRRPIYRALNRGGHRAEDDEGEWAFRTELHHKPGDGLTREMLHDVLEPLGFSVGIYPHNNHVGAEALHGDMGRQPLKIRVGQRLSGIRPDTETGALLLLCVAQKGA
ncbi:MAG: class SAM-dependent methyltransferase [Mycobacterium sp.]|nr:class SAM-dependent methyltransferase [Mycobacterium sp.]